MAIGRDSCISGAEVAEAAAVAARAHSVHVFDFGMATTPAMFMSIVFPGCGYHCAVMITASYLPPDRNGINVFAPKGSAYRDDINEVLDSAANAIAERNGVYIPHDPRAMKEQVIRVDFVNVYAAHTVRLIRNG